MGQRFVEDVGPVNAKIVLVGEAPGREENRLGIPFQGAAGWKLNDWLRGEGIDRRECYITNVYPFQPPANKIEAVPKEELSHWIEELHTRLGALDDPWVIVPMGNTALTALTGKKGIGKHRGSILSYKDNHSRTVKCIPTIHPAATFREPWYEKPCRADWRRIADDSTFRELRLPERTHITGRELRIYEDFYREASEKATIMSIDIETTPEIILCVGFSFDASYSITIPTDSPGYSDNPGAVQSAWSLVKALCDLPCEKTLQNGSYDTFRLAHYKIKVRNYKWDTLALHHAIDASDAHDLAYMASVDTRQPYWKDECKDPDELQKYASNIDALWVYNGIDCCVQRELTDIYIDRVREAGKLDFYEKHYRKMFAPILDMMRHGIRVNNKARKLKSAQLEVERYAMHDKLTEIAGEPLYGKKDLSNKKLAKFLYETLRLPKQVDRKTQNTTVKEVVVRKLMLKYPAKLDAPGKLILDIRRNTQLGKFLQDKRVDNDGRMRCTYKNTTEAGRLSSSKSPTGTGTNLQNQDREIRNIYVPDKGCVFLQGDMSQVESRIVNILTGDKRLIEQARMMPWEYDMHTDNAMQMFKAKREDITYIMRYLGKKTIHGAQRGLRGLKLSEELLKDGYVYTSDECDRMVDAYLNANPAILDWQRSVRITILRDRCLSNSWGRLLEFKYERMGEDVYRRGYSFVPQAECADAMNQMGLIPLRIFLKARGFRTKINAHGHDSLLMSCPPDEAYEVAMFMKTSIERPRVIAGHKLSIPCTFALGKTWKMDVEFKRMPSEEEFTMKAHELAVK